MVVDRHLGGYVKGGDPATYYPELWKWLIENKRIIRMLDLGCGEGHAMNYFNSLLLPVGGDCFGIDGMPQPQLDRRLFFQWDYASPLMGQPVMSVDFIWCCEFLEHIEERFLWKVAKTIGGCEGYVALTHAGPGQLGHHHVNCRDAEYWRGFMAGLGFELDVALTTQARLLARLNTNPYNHFLRSGMVFGKALQ